MKTCKWPDLEMLLIDWGLARRELELHVVRFGVENRRHLGARGERCELDSQKVAVTAFTAHGHARDAAVRVCVCLSLFSMFLCTTCVRCCNAWVFVCYEYVLSTVCVCMHVYVLM